MRMSIIPGFPALTLILSDVFAIQRTYLQSLAFISQLTLQPLF